MFIGFIGALFESVRRLFGCMSTAELIVLSFMVSSQMIYVGSSLLGSASPSITSVKSETVLARFILYFNELSRPFEWPMFFSALVLGPVSSGPES